MLSRTFSNTLTGSRTSPKTLVGLSLAYFLVLLDTTVLTVALPDLRASLGGSFAGQQWAVNGYTVAFAASLLTSGAVSDRYGAARVFRAGIVAFGAVSLLCALAPGLGVLVVLRALLGVAGALCLSGSLGLIAQLYPDPAGRARAMGVWAAVSGTALAAGPLAGGLLTGLYGWRAVFLVNPLLAAAGVLVTRGLTSPAGRTRIDWPVQAAACAFLALLADAATEVSLPPLVASAVVLALLVWRERRGSAPALPGGLLRATGPGLATGAVVNFAFAGALFVITLLLQGAGRLTPLETGLAFLPLTVPMTFNALVTGRVVARFGPRPSVAAGLVLLFAGLVASGAAVRAASGLGPLLVCGLALMGFGLSCCLPALVAGVVSAAPPGLAGTAGGVLNAVRQVGATLGVAVMGVVAKGTTGDGTSAALFLAAGLVLLAAPAIGWAFTGGGAQRAPRAPKAPKAPKAAVRPGRGAGS
ncbi:MFS transporter [Sphaerisporangium corydalis]|uniref:MFS transporter n=1 Tax=Sphaerisporangium corydalis TaxID=1441875 RepID=A0ABV9EIG4_9ACTN|nr:MFS transporter [Sphaerisporangium corydalis]